MQGQHGTSMRDERIYRTYGVSTSGDCATNCDGHRLCTAFFRREMITCQLSDVATLLDCVCGVEHGSIYYTHYPGAES